MGSRRLPRALAGAALVALLGACSALPPMPPPPPGHPASPDAEEAPRKAPSDALTGKPVPAAPPTHHGHDMGGMR